MKLTCYTIYDVKGLTYHAPWFQHTDGLAVRVLTDLVNDSNTSIGKHPKDYTLYACGTWDDQLGLFWPTTPLRHVSDAVSLIIPQPQTDLLKAAE